MSDEYRYFIFDQRALGACGRREFLDKAIVLAIEDSLRLAEKEARDFGGGAIYKATRDSEFIWVKDIYH